MIKVPIQGKETYLTAEQILSYHFTHLKDIAEVRSNRTVKDVAISVSSYFDNMQTKAVERAATLVGLNAYLLVSESTAASKASHTEFLKMRHDTGEDKSETYVLVCNIDEGWLSITVKNYSRGVYRTMASWMRISLLTMKGATIELSKAWSESQSRGTQLGRHHRPRHCRGLAICRYSRTPVDT